MDAIKAAQKVVRAAFRRVEKMKDDAAAKRVTADETWVTAIAAAQRTAEAVKTVDKANLATAKAVETVAKARKMEEKANLAAGLGSSLRQVRFILHLSSLCHRLHGLSCCQVRFILHLSSLCHHF
ncbi:unnamed protein product [Ectocarpus sp. 6 AP-2014]